MQVRPATQRDAPAIARVHVDAWRTTYAGIVPATHLASLTYERSEQRTRQHMADGSFYCVAELDGGAVVGFAAGGKERSGAGPPDGELYAIYILQPHQHRGVGRLLVSHIAQHLQQVGLHSMLIWTLADNRPARAFSERLGGTFVRSQQIQIGGVPLEELAYAWPDLAPLCRARDD